MTDSIPTRLDVSVNPKNECAMYDVYFNGRLQKDCVIADSQTGYIKRYQRHFGVMARNGAGNPMTEEKTRTCCDRSERPNAGYLIRIM